MNIVDGRTSWMEAGTTETTKTVETMKTARPGRGGFARAVAMRDSALKRASTSHWSGIRDAENREFPVWAVKDLAKSGITPEQAAAVGFRPVEPDEYFDILGFNPSEAGDGYVIPFFDPSTGEPMLTPFGGEFQRVKLCRPVKMGENSAKYLSPKDGGVHVYLPSDLADLPEGETLYVTEGEKKALCATLHGIPMAGLVGVTGFGDKETRDIHPDLLPLVVDGRPVVFIVDSDAASNIDIARAVHRFSRYAAAHGSPFKALVLPPRYVPVDAGTDDDATDERRVRIEKVGVDDLVMAEGIERLREVLKTAEPVVENSPDELYLKWIERLAVDAASRHVEPTTLAAEILRKGYYSGLTVDTRREAKARIADAFPELLVVLENAIQDRMQSEFAGETSPENGGADLRIDCHASAPGQPDAVKVRGFQGDLVWCSIPGRGDACRPFPKRLLVLAPQARGGAANGSLGGRPQRPSPTEVSNALLALPVYKIDGVCAIRHLRGQWYLWDGACYAPMQEEEVVSRVMCFLRNRPEYQAYANNSMVRDVLLHLKSFDVGGLPSNTEVPSWINTYGIDRDFLKSSTGWLPLHNCLLNLEMHGKFLDGEVNRDAVSMPPTPCYFSPFALPYDFDPDATCPQFDKYLEQVQPGPEAREVIQMLMGLSLVPITHYNVFFLLHGRGGEGKSVFLHILGELVGRDNVAHVPFCKFGDKFSIGLLTESLVDIIGDDDTETSRDLSMGRVEGVIKEVADGGLIAVEHKFKEPGKARATARIVMAANALPTFQDRNDGLWDRLRIIPFERRIRGTADEDPALRTKIVETEMPGILNFALAGLNKLCKLRKFPEVPAGLKAKEAHRLRCNNEADFLTAYFQEGDNAGGSFITTTRLYEDYREWMRKGGFNPVDIKRFKDAVQRTFKNAVPKRIRDGESQVMCWTGFVRRNDADLETSDPTGGSKDEGVQPVQAVYLGYGKPN